MCFLSPPNFVRALLLYLQNPRDQRDKGRVVYVVARTEIEYYTRASVVERLLSLSCVLSTRGGGPSSDAGREGVVKEA